MDIKLVNKFIFEKYRYFLYLKNNRLYSINEINFGYLLHGD